MIHCPVFSMYGIQCSLAPHTVGEHVFTAAARVEAGITGATTIGSGGEYEMYQEVNKASFAGLEKRTIDLPFGINPRGPQNVDHPSHYGGKDNPHEHVKCAEAWGLVDTPLVGAWLYNASKYICRAGKKSETPAGIDLKKAIWYLERAVERLEKEDKS